MTEEKEKPRRHGGSLARHLRDPRWWLAAGLIAGLGALGVAGFVWSVPVPAALRRPDPRQGTVTLLDARGGPLAELPGQAARSSHPLPLDRLGADLPRITVALEDQRFYRHHGPDGLALLAALARDVRAGRVVSGASTITEQLVKLANGRPGGRTLGTKLREAAAAWKLERRMGKAEILERYLNALSYGNRLVGPQAAARAYFDKDAAALTFAEAVYLAGLPQAPTRLNPWRHPAAAEFRYGRSVRRLAALGLVAPAEARRLADAPPHPGRFLAVRRAGHFVDLLTARQRRGLLPEAPGGVLRTTLDPDLQRVAETLTRHHLDDLRREGDEDPQAAVVIVENATGAVRALVGSGNYDDPQQGQVNGAVRPRSAGSTLKPFLYLNAFDRRLLTAASILPDTAEAVRETFADYDPQNYHAGRHLGPVSVRTALGSSLNVPAVVTLGRFVGARQAFYEFGRWGFRFSAGLDDYGAGFILGNAEIRLLDLAGAYAGLARGGLAANRVRLLARDTAPLERVASPEACEIVTDILCDPQARRATFGVGSPLDFPDGVRVAVKTGTSSGFRDKWCVGFDGRHTVAVWSGHFDGRPMGEAIGIHAAAPLWHALMEHLLREHQDPAVPAPVLDEKLTRREVCPLTGLLPAPEAGGPAGTPEFFLAGTEPTARAADHFLADASGGPAHLRLPPEYAAWCRSPQNLLGAVVPPESANPAAPGTTVLAVISPPEHARYTLDPELSVRQQMLELTANTTDPALVRWTVNGQPIAPQADGRVFWPLARGTWSVGATLPGAVAVLREIVVE